MKSVFRNNQSGSVTIFIIAILAMVGIFYAANVDSFQASKNYIYQNQQKEALQELSQVVAVILSNEVACRQFMNSSGLLNSNWSSAGTQELNPKFFDSAGDAGDVIAEKIFVHSELKNKPVFKLVKAKTHSARTILAQLQPYYSSTKGTRFNTEQFEIPIFLEINAAQNMVGCRTTVKSNFDNSETIDDYLCKAFEQQGRNMIYSFGLSTCEEKVL